jgi:hypothetical protein
MNANTPLTDKTTSRVVIAASAATGGKTRGANIACAVCGAEPYPDDPAIRETFELRRYGPDGKIAEGPKPGEWRCSQHIPERRLSGKEISP